MIVGSTVGWGLFWEWCGWATFCVQILSANATKRGAPQSWLSASGFSLVSSHYFACQKHIFCILLEITIGTACEGMVAVHIALTWALGIVCGTGYLLIFFCGRKFGSGSIDVCGAALCWWGCLMQVLVCCGWMCDAYPKGAGAPRCWVAPPRRRLHRYHSWFTSIMIIRIPRSLGRA